jgi:hypothetical protein
MFTESFVFVTPARDLLTAAWKAAADAAPAYRTPSFAAPREYGPEEGWVTVKSKNTLKNIRRRRQGRADESYPEGPYELE